MSCIYWLASYPKSGNTWVRALLTNYLRNSDEPADINDLDIDGAGFMRERFDEYLGIDSTDLTLRQIQYYRPLVYEKMAEAAVEPTFLKIHDSYQYNSEGEPIFSERATAGAIYLIRNPLDVAVSLAHHRNSSIDDTIRLMNKPDAFLSKFDGAQLPQKTGDWSSHAASWNDVSGLNIRVFRYEDLIKDTRKTFSEIVRFAGLNFDPELIERSVEFSRFERLREQENKQGFKEKQPTADSFFRQGKAGSWREVLNNKQADKIISAHRDIMRRFGYLDTNGELTV